MSRLLIVGIDGMDWHVLGTFLQELQTIREIGRSGYAGEMKSIFPPDSIPAWVSIFTGLDPSEHGVLETIDYFKKDIKEFAIDTSAMEGKTFWDLAGAVGKRVIVVNPLLAYPPWKVNGIMASGPVFVSGEAKIYPETLQEKYRIPPLGGIVDFPQKRELTAFVEKIREETREIVDFTARLMTSEPWDIVFVSILTLDRILHFFWRYFDKEDPTHPGVNKYETVIRDFHCYLDECVNRLREVADEDTILLILSDHGHGRRPTHLLNLNQLLLENGLLKSRISGHKMLSPRYHIERTKNIALETLHRLDMEDLAYRIAHILPWTRKLKKRDFLTEPQNNLSTASEFGGTNPFGGVDISKERCKAEGLDYEELRNRIISLLLGVRDDDGAPMFLWAKRREEIYSGPFIEKFPDVLYEMKQRYGTSWSLHLPLVTLNPRHKKISGGHRANGVCIIGPLNTWRVRREQISPLNVTATVLHVLTDGEIDYDALHIQTDMKGRSFLEKD